MFVFLKYVYLPLKIWIWFFNAVTTLTIAYCGQILRNKNKRRCKHLENTVTIICAKNTKLQMHFSQNVAFHSKVIFNKQGHIWVLRVATKHIFESLQSVHTKNILMQPTTIFSSQIDTWRWKNRRVIRVKLFCVKRFKHFAIMCYLIKITDKNMLSLFY